MELQMDCDCMEEQCRIGAFEVSEIWSDRQGGMSERADLCRCLECHRYWLRYSQIDESSPSYGKWYRGAIDTEQAVDLTPDGARELFAELPWHFYGGPYYRTSGEFENGPIKLQSISCNLELVQAA